MDKHWSGYLNAVSGTPIPKTSMPAPYPATDTSRGTSGFMDLLVTKPEVQKRYDAMESTWEGVSASDAAISSGLFKGESMPVPSQNIPVQNKK
jgi:hypothetical protein